MPFKLPDIITAGVFDMSIRYPDVNITSPRKAQDFEIEMPIKNNATIHIDNVCHEVSIKDILCIKPGMVRRSTKPYSCYYIHLSTEDNSISDLLSNLPTITRINHVEKFYDIYSNMISTFNFKSDPIRSIGIYSEVLKLIKMIYVYNEKVERKAVGRNAAVLNAIEYMNDNFTYEITLNDIAEAVHLSPIYLRELFTSEMGMSPHNYILNKRIKKAKELLIINLSSISEIATLSGFSSQSYFDYVFKKHTGMTPKQFRAEESVKKSL